MMEVSVSTWSLSKCGSTMEEWFRTAKAAGISYLDFTLDACYQIFDWRQVSEEEVFAYFSEVKKLAATYGLKVFQTHAPYAGFPDYLDEEYFGQTVKAIAATAALGAKYTVGHPFPFPLYGKKNMWEKERAFTVRYYKRFIPALEKYGVTMCVENIYDWDNGNIRQVGFSDTKNIASIAEELGEYFGTCLDTGHYALYGGNQAQAVRELGKTLKVLHIHDSFGVKDDHLIPRLGGIDWSGFTDALKEVGYEGTLNMELKPYPYMDSAAGFVFAKERMLSL